MKTAVVLILIFLTGQAFAKSQAASPQFPFMSRWADTKTVTNTVLGDTVKMRVRQRYMKFGRNFSAVATMTSGEITSKNPQNLPTDFIGGIGKLTGIKKWRKENRGSYMAYEAELPDYVRYLKVFVSKKGNTFKYSIATIRLPFLMPTYFETEVLQRMDIGDSKGVASLEQSGGIYAAIFHTLVAPAEALDSLGSIIDPYLSSAGTTALAPTAGSLTTSLSGLGNAFQNDYLKGLSTANGLSYSFTSGITSISSMINTSMGQATVLANGAETSINGLSNSITGVTNSVNKLENPNTLFKMGAAAGLGLGLGATVGSAVGGLLIQFIADGVVPLAEKLFQEITGYLPDDVKNKVQGEGKDAWNQLAKLSYEVGNLQQQMAKNLIVLEALGQGNVMNQRKMDSNVELDDWLIRKDTAIMDKTTDAAILNQCADQIGQLKNEMKGFAQVKEILKANGNTSQEDVCHSFNAMYSQWVNMEVEMNLARATLTNDMSVMVTSANDDLQKALKGQLTDKQKTRDCDKTPYLDGIDTDIKNQNCLCDSQGPATTSVCEALCSDRQTSVAYKPNCLPMTKPETDQQRIMDRHANLQTLTDYSKMMQANYRQLQQANCTATDNVDGCGGKDGDFTHMKNSMQGLFQKINAECPPGSTFVNLEQQKDVAAGEAKANLVMNNNLPLASQPPANLPTPAESGGFHPFRAFGNAVGNFFKSFGSNNSSSSAAPSSSTTSSGDSSSGTGPSGSDNNLFRGH